MPKTAIRPAISPGAAFAELMAAARREAGLSQDQLATQAGVARTTIIRWESGHARMFEFEALKSVCRVLNVRQHDALTACGFDELDQAA